MPFSGCRRSGYFNPLALKGWRWKWRSWRNTLSHTHDAALDGDGDGVDAVKGTDLLQNDADVQADGAHAQLHHIDDLFGGLSTHEVAQDFEFAVGESARKLLLRGRVE